jgi:hypothetical protein
MRDFVDQREAVRNAGLVGDGRKVQHRVGRAAERHVHGERVEKGFFTEDIERADVFVEKLHDLLAGGLGKPCARGVDGGDGTVAGQRDADGLAQAVHGVGREHAGA